MSLINGSSVQAMDVQVADVQEIVVPYARRDIVVKFPVKRMVT